MYPCLMDFFHFDGWPLSPSMQESLQQLQTSGHMVWCCGSFVQCVSVPYFLHTIIIAMKFSSSLHHQGSLLPAIADAIL